METKVFTTNSSQFVSLYDGLVSHSKTWLWGRRERRLKFRVKVWYYDDDNHSSIILVKNNGSYSCFDAIPLSRYAPPPPHNSSPTYIINTLLGVSCDAYYMKPNEETSLKSNQAKMSCWREECAQKCLFNSVLFWSPDWACLFIHFQRKQNSLTADRLKAKRRR